MARVGQDQPAVAESGEKSASLELVGGAFVALATLLGALVDLESSGNSRSVAWQLLAFVVVAAAVIGLLWRRGKLTRGQLTRALVFVLFGFLLAGGVIAVNLWKSEHRSEPITISSVAIDQEGVLQDGGDLFLNQLPKVECECPVSGSALRTDDVLKAHCQVNGAWIYNADIEHEKAVRNVAFFKSKRWYGATDEDGRSGYISEVRVDQDDRGGLNLPDCRRG